jgi:hypothetical protein
MKKLITIALLLISFSVYSQVYTKQPWYGLQVARVQADSVLTLPTGLGTLRQTENTRQLRYNTADSSLYVWSGFSWLKSGGGGADSSIFATQYQIDTLQQTYDGVFADINGRLAGKVKYSDSTTTFATPTQLAAKLNIVDTANIRARLIAGSNITLSGTYPNITINGSAAGWGLSGNSGTNQSTNFVGTTDLQNFIVKTNNGNANFSVGSGNNITDGSFEIMRFDGTNVNNNISIVHINPNSKNVGNNRKLFRVDGAGGSFEIAANGTVTVATALTVGTILSTSVIENASFTRFRLTNSTELMRLDYTNQSLLLGTSTNVPSSQFTMNSTTKGFLPPRMTNTQRAAISSPAIGLIVYCTDAVEGLYIYKSTGWTLIM